MDIKLSEDQIEIARQARRFCENESPMEFVRAMYADDQGFTEDLWTKMAEMGWTAMCIPEPYGGLDLDLLDLAVLLEEMGRALLPGPFFTTVVLGGLLVLENGSEEQRQRFLPDVVKGKVNLTLTLAEPDSRYRFDAIRETAVEENNEYVINGTKLFVPCAHVADGIICAAKTDTGAPEGEGISLFIVDKNLPGITCKIMETIAMDKQCEVVFDKVKVPQQNILGQQDEGWEVMEQILRWAAVAECALMLGGAQRASEMAIDYAKERVQYGNPIGHFQVIQHKCADMAIDIEGARYLTYQAAWKLSQGLPCTMEVSMAKAWVGKACSRVCAQACHLHGAMGYTEDHDTQLYLRRIKAAELTFGDATFHQEIVAQELGL